VVNHHQVAVLAEQFFLVGFDLHLRSILRFSHRAPPKLQWATLSQNGMSRMRAAQFR
jgi:hypothetical protein